MSYSLGIHLGLHAVTAVAVDRRGKFIDALNISRQDGPDCRLYSERELSAAIEQLQQRFSRQQCTVVLSLPIIELYYRRVQCPEGGIGRLDAVRYAVEPLVPVPIEQVHISVVDRDNRSTGVAVIPLHPWRQLFSQFDEAGWICPRVVGDATALWRFISRTSSSDDRLELLCIADPVEGAIIASSEGRVLAAHPFYGKATSTAATDPRWLSVETARIAWACGSVDEQLITHLVVPAAADDDSIPGLDVSSVQVHHMADLLPDTAPHSLGVLYAYSAAKLLSANEKRIENLRTGDLASSAISKRNLNALVSHSIAAMVFLLVMTCGMWFHGHRCKEQTSVYRGTCKQIWASLFPTSAAPADVSLRLQSELARERGLRRQNVTVPQHSSSLDVLRDVVAALPADVPIRVEQLDLSDRVSVISGQARTHGEVEQIANRLAQIKYLTVLPARTERTNKNDAVVRFTLRLEQKEKSDVNSGTTVSKTIAGSSSSRVWNHFAGLDLAMAKGTGAVSVRLANSGPELRISGGLDHGPAAATALGRGPHSRFAYPRRLPGAGGAEGRDEPEQYPFDQAGVSPPRQGLALRRDGNPGAIDRDVTGRYDEADLALAARDTRAGHSRTSRVDRIARVDDMGGRVGLGSAGLQPLATVAPAECRMILADTERQEGSI